jgi:hypothetical protein
MGVDSVLLGYRRQGNKTTLQGNKRDCRVATRSLRPSRALSDGVVEPCGALPRKCYLFIYSQPRLGDPTK